MGLYVLLTYKKKIYNDNLPFAIRDSRENDREQQRDRKAVRVTTARLSLSHKNSLKDFNKEIVTSGSSAQLMNNGPRKWAHQEGRDSDGPAADTGRTRYP